MRIYEFSKLHGVASKDIIEFLQKQGIEAKSHMAVIAPEVIPKLEKQFGPDLSSSQKKEKAVIPPTHIVQEEAPAPSARKESQIMQQQPSPAKKTTSYSKPSRSSKPSRPSFAQKKPFERRAPEKVIPVEKSFIENPLIAVPMTVGDFSLKAGKPVNEVIVALLKQGRVYAKNHLLTEEQVINLAQQYEVETVKPVLQKPSGVSADSLRSIKVGQERLPIVVVMGHVDHGKTTLLDYIRKTRVVAREKGGITQHIGAYEAHTPQGNIVFLDTPGHEAFAKVRRRGAFIADLAVLVVAADDGIMPQTVECIKALKSLEIPVIVAINKVDKVEKTRIDIVLRQLSQYDLLPEQWGGNIICVPISAKDGTGVDHLLEMILLQSQLMDLQGNQDLPAEGYVLESKVEKGRGSVATVICRHGRLAVGDFFRVGDTYGKVIALKDSAGTFQQSVGPSVPVMVTGFDSLPSVGTFFQVIDEKEFKKLRISKEEQPSTSSTRRPSAVTTGTGTTRSVLNLIVKSDGNSSLEAILDGIEKLSKKTEKPFSVIHSGVSNVTENDVILAENTGSYIVGFGVKADHAALLYARKAKIEIKLFDIIYRLFEDIEQYAKKNEDVKKVITKIGEAAVLKVFVVKKFGVVAGCIIKDGKFSDKGTVSIFRHKKEVGKGKIKSLQRDKKSVKEVHAGFECAFLVEGFEDWLVDDRVECYVESIAS